MKTIYIVRHARAHKKRHNSNDFEQRLTDEGERDAHNLGIFLRNKNILPDLIICSTAERAIKTVEILADAINFPRPDIELNESLYEIEIEELLDILRHLDDKYESVMFVGHNPPMSIMSDYLTRYGVGNLAPGSIFCCEFKVDTWKAITKYGGICKFFESPRN